MPLTKYYCDYCDKQFQDTPSAIKRHIQGVQHQRNKALWYESFRDPNQHQLEGFGRGVCNRFVRTGICHYGDSCKYFHPKQNIQNPNIQGIPGANFAGNFNLPAMLGTQLTSGSTMTGNVVGDAMGISYGNLPPSLRLPPEGGYPPLPFVDWG